MARAQYRRPKLLGSGMSRLFQWLAHINHNEPFESLCLVLLISGKYRIFLGLLVVPVYRKPTTEAVNTGTSGTKRIRDDNREADVAPTKDPKTIDDDLDDLDDDDEDDEDSEEAPESEEFREDRLVAFLNDPERAVRIFMSSHMREKGLIW